MQLSRIKEEILDFITQHGIDGEILSFVGPNGAGKSTLLKAW